MNKTEQARDWFLRAKKCTRCEIRNTCSQVVPGAGNSTAEVMFLGEGPGQKEDDKGLPFVGHAGKFLDTMIESNGLSRKDVFITNVVRCRPPDNRDPLEEEIGNCSLWTEEIIKIIKPSIIVTLGKFGMGYFGIKEKISKIHGNIFLLNDYTVITLYHPAAALHNPNLKPVLIADFANVKKFISGDHDGLTIHDKKIQHTADANHNNTEIQGQDTAKENTSEASRNNKSEHMQKDEDRPQNLQQDREVSDNQQENGSKNTVDNSFKNTLF
jgi:uracil-DNA glycosylase